METLQPDPLRDPAQTIGSVELVAEAGITYRQCDYWTRVGFLRADVPARGSGSQRRFGPAEIAVARLLAVLVPLKAISASAVTPERVRSIAEHARSGGRGSVELIPGVSLDLDLLCGEDVDEAAA